MCCEAPKHAMDEFFERTKKVEVVGDLDLYQLPSIICLYGSTSFIAPKLVVVQPSKPTWIIERYPNMGG